MPIPPCRTLHKISSSLANQHRIAWMVEIILNVTSQTKACTLANSFPLSHLFSNPVYLVCMSESTVSSHRWDSITADHSCPTCKNKWHDAALPNNMASSLNNSTSQPVGCALFDLLSPSSEVEPTQRRCSKETCHPRQSNYWVVWDLHPLLAIYLNLVK